MLSVLLVLELCLCPPVEEVLRVLLVLDSQLIPRSYTNERACLTGCEVESSFLKDYLEYWLRVG